MSQAGAEISETPEITQGTTPRTTPRTTPHCFNLLRTDMN